MREETSIVLQHIDFADPQSHDVSVKTTPRVGGAAIDESHRRIAYFYEPTGVYCGRDEIDRSRARSRLLTLTFAITQLPARGIGQWRRIQWVSGRPGEHQLMPGLISSLPEMADCRSLSLFRQATMKMDSVVRQSLSSIGSGGKIISRCLGAPPAPE